MQDTQHAHQIAGHVIDQDVISMRDQLTSAGDATRPAEARVIDQARGPL